MAAEEATGFGSDVTTGSVGSFEAPFDDGCTVITVS
jgi:hypothetical protein